MQINVNVRSLRKTACAAVRKQERAQDKLHAFAVQRSKERESAISKQAENEADRIMARIPKMLAAAAREGKTDCIVHSYICKDLDPLARENQVDYFLRKKLDALCRSNTKLCWLPEWDVRQYKFDFRLGFGEKLKPQCSVDFGS